MITMSNVLTIIQPKRKATIQRVHIPAWLSDPDKPAPCLCGQPMSPDQPMVMGTGELGMKRWFHLSCWNMMMQDADDDWEDEDAWDEEDDEE